ncbi:hypothetical protein [Vibrio harveyi]|uniref:hypothetical protein n=1 Tax=Vibrio harveyi TaxID=669 RepID=UPI0018F1FCBE|nr:hypothetical protein [Vibrio harveyi]
MSYTNQLVERAVNLTADLNGKRELEVLERAINFLPHCEVKDILEELWDNTNEYLEQYPDADSTYGYITGGSLELLHWKQIQQFVRTLEQALDVEAVEAQIDETLDYDNASMIVEQVTLDATDEHHDAQDKVLEALQNNEYEFEFETDGEGDFLAVEESHLESVVRDRLESDPYIVGCHFSHVLESVTGLDSDLIDALQAGEQWEKLGQWVIDNYLTELVEHYMDDIYGAVAEMLSSYDHSCEEITLGGNNNLTYYIFRTN